MTREAVKRARSVTAALGWGLSTDASAEDRAGADFFTAVKSMTITGYYDPIHLQSPDGDLLRAICIRLLAEQPRSIRRETGLR